MKHLTDKLIQKYLKGKTSREEERELLDICLRDINNLITKYRETQLVAEK